jgi:hypothetical protein
MTLKPPSCPGRGVGVGHFIDRAYIKGARKKAQKSPARAFRILNVNQDSHRTPITAITFL